MNYRFGQCELDSGRLELSRDGALESVEPQVFSLLVHLIENRERVVSKDELIAAVWDGRIVSDATLSSRINAARRAVGDTGKDQTVIRTVPRRGFRFVGTLMDSGVPAPQNTPGAESAATSLQMPDDDRPSVAVLPFGNLSNDPEQDYFSDGMTEDLITDISKISGVSVVSRNSSFAFKNRNADVTEIARTLRVQHVVEGSVRKMGERLRVNAQLIDAASGRHVWAERYDGNMSEIFDFQDDIRAQIISALQLNLTKQDQRLAERKSTSSAAAYDVFLKGRASFSSYTRDNLHDAIENLEEAIRIDPSFADAFGYLSYCYLIGYVRMLPGSNNNLAAALELAEKGAKLDRSSAIALARLGYIQTFSRCYEQALVNFGTAISLEPENAEVHAAFGHTLNFWGDPERGLEMLRKAIELENFAQPSWLFQIGLSHMLLHRFDEALAQLDLKNVQLMSYGPVYLWKACVLVELGKLRDARDAMKAALEITPQYTVSATSRIFPYRRDDVRDRLLNNLRRVGLPEG